MRAFLRRIIFLMPAIFVLTALVYLSGVEGDTVERKVYGPCPGGALVIPDPGIKSFASAPKSVKEIAPGIRYYVLAGFNWRKEPVKVHVVEVDPGYPLTEIRLATGGNIGKTETVSGFATKHGAAAAINGGFFSMVDGTPVGSLVDEGRLLSTSYFLRTSVGITSDNGLIIGYFSPRMVVRSANGGVLTVDAFNSSTPSGDVLLYSSKWIRSSIGGTGTSNLIIEGDAAGNLAVTGITQGQSPIPKGGYILSLSGEAVDYASDFPIGAKVEITSDFGTAWNSLKYLVTAGPMIVENGVPVFRDAAEGFRGSVTGVSARSAIGLDADNRIVLVQVEKSPLGSAGMTLEELAYLMTDLGCARACGLDGGGSSAMCINGKLVGKPSGGSERRVANAFLVLSQVPVYMDGERLFFDVPPVVENGRVLVPLRKIFEALKAEVSWDEANKSVRAVRDAREVVLTADKVDAFINSRPSRLDVPAKVVDGRVLVPLRFVSEALGAKVSYKPTPPVVEIKSGISEEVHVVKDMPENTGV